MPLEELKQATLAKVQEMVTDQSDGSPRYLLPITKTVKHIESHRKVNYIINFLFRENK